MANEYLKRTPTSTGNNRVFTWSGWVKRNIFAANYAASQNLFRASGGSGGDCGWRFDFTTPADSLRLFLNGAASGNVQADGKNRDASAWMHIMVSFNSTLDQDSERIRIYVNGVRVPDNNTGYPTINYQTSFNERVVQSIGAFDDSGSPTEFFGGELADLFLVDGQALTPDVFGFYKVGKGYVSAGSTQSTDFRPGQWVPKTPRVIKTAINNNGGFGVNGFYLPMNDSNNFGADFHCDPNSIIKLQENLPQPRSRIDGVGDYTGALRDDPFKQYLVLALPFVSGGLQSGFGDYSAAIKGSGSPKTITNNSSVSIGNTASYYGSAASFNGSNAYLTTPNTGDFDFGSGDFTIEYWALDNTVTGERRLLYLYNTAQQEFIVGHSGQKLFFAAYDSSRNLFGQPTTGNVLTINQWNHIAVEKYKTNLTIYVNGVAGAISTTYTGTIRSGQTPLYIGYDPVAAGRYFNGYLQDLRIYKGVAKYKGGFDVPRPYTPVGIATWRAVPDSPANNFATLNPLVGNYTDANFFPSDGNLSITVTNNNGYRNYPSTFSPENFKGYLELRWSTGTPNGRIGITDVNKQDTNLQYTSAGTFLIDQDGNVRNGPTTVKSGCTPSFSSGDTLQIAFDFTGSNKNIWFGRNGTWGDNTVGTGNPSLGINPMFTSSDLTAEYRFYFGINTGAGTQIVNMNFGQNPTFSGNTTAGTYTDSNNKGLFKYQPPSGFLALCEDNLPTPAISDPGKYFKTVLWTGDGNSGRSIVGVGFTPDLVWIKRRNGASDHVLQDSVRGFGSATKLSSSSTKAESVVDGGATDPRWGYLNSADNDGFSLNASTNGDQVNKSTADPYVAWCWRAGAGTTSTNTNGSITSVVSVNQDAGFSIVSYTGNGSAGETVGHGLGITPAMVIIKSRNEVRSWIVFHRGASPTPNPLSSTTFALGSLSSGCLSLNLANGTFAYTMDGQTNVNGNTYIAYCWSEIEGFSKAFSYVGNGSTDGPLVYLNFKPAFVIIKQTNDTGDWYIFDSSRNSTNPVTLGSISNTTQIDGDYTGWGDFLSNGFKIRRTDSAWNGSGSTYVGFAWAESPFQTANAK